MEGPIAIGALALLAGLAIWFGVSEAKSGATSKEAGKAMREVIDAGKRFEKARRDSAGMPRRERVYLMLQELRARPRTEVPADE